ncbi:MAG: ATP-binding protein [Bacteroidales bacterium]|jgi:predicted ATPase|nr:ATP-binding protein [Bacteroidales bacterium]
MSAITIKNLGPIKDVTLNMNKINVITGPQSSGKSAIAKLISFCSWLDKKFARDGGIKPGFENGNDVKLLHYIDTLKNYYRLTNGYFSDDTELYFNGEKIEFSLNCDLCISHSETVLTDGSFRLGIKETRQRYNSKVVYIPSERNFVSSIYNLHQYIGDHDFIQDLIQNWYNAKRKYTSNQQLDVLNLGVRYYYGGDDIDRLQLANGKELTLQAASSGLQSVVPLITLFDYIARGIYNESRPMSVTERDELVAKYNELLQKSATPVMNTDDLSTLFDIIVLKNYNYSQFIVEEPEQNLFPITQRDLVYYMIRMCNSSKYNHRLTMTTHSPYILYALNNCMMGYLVKDAAPADERILSRESWIDPQLVSVWEIEDGKIRSIQDEDNIVSENYFDLNMTELTDEYYHMLNFYED